MTWCGAWLESPGGLLAYLSVHDRLLRYHSHRLTAPLTPESQRLGATTTIYSTHLATMRLLDTHTRKLVEYFDPDIPPYAILSHRWGSEEVSFTEMLDHGRRVERKAGFAKIKKFCTQARQGGYKYAWVDTCCINKDSSAELSEAINSMFRWYDESAVCYAYLSDVPGTLGQDDKMEALKKSEWFTRGWTLQELIAPRELSFYAADWTELGTRRNLRPMIESITGIPTSALGASIKSLSSMFSIAQRMSWSANRVTTREEDRAYCLLGIFDVNMPLLYGEKSKAFLRLQEHIISMSNDQSIFAWGLNIITTRCGTSNHALLYANSPSDLLAPSPLLFKGCGTIKTIPGIDKGGDFKTKKSDMRITGPILNLRKKNSFAGAGDHLLYLRCYDQKTPTLHLAIMLRELGVDSFSRKNQTLCRLTGPIWSETESRTIHIRTEGAIPSYRENLHSGKSLAFNINTDVLAGTPQVLECWPGGQWLEDHQLVVAPPWKDTDTSVNKWSWHVVLKVRMRLPTAARLGEEQGQYVDYTMSLGYDGIHSRCWITLKPGHGNLEDVWSSIDTTEKSARHKIVDLKSKSGWEVTVNLAQSYTPEKEMVRSIQTTHKRCEAVSWVASAHINISEVQSQLLSETRLIETPPAKRGEEEENSRTATENQSFVSVVDRLLRSREVYIAFRKSQKQEPRPIVGYFP